MAWRYHGRAHTNTSSPTAYACCDRCGMWYNRDKLYWQFDYAGIRLQNLRILVCKTCLDVPQPQKKPVVVPPDPVPVMNPRPDLYRPLMPFILTDTNGREITDTSGAYSPVTAPQGPAGYVDGSYTYWLPPNGYPPELLNIGMTNQQTGQPLTTQGGVVTTQEMDGYELRSDYGGTVSLIPT